MTSISVRLRVAVASSVVAAALGSVAMVVAATPVSAAAGHAARSVRGPLPQPPTHAAAKAPPQHAPTRTAPAARSKASAPPYQVNVGYADTLRANPANFPTPWEGDPNVVYEGCSGGCSFDSSAIELVNTSSHALTVNSVVLTFDASCVYDIWPHTVNLPVNGEMVLTENVGGGPGGCTVSSQQIDGSDIGPGGVNWAGNCNQSGVVPQVTATVGGKAQTYTDTGQVLNTGGTDGASCNPATSNESTQWTPIGQTACAGLVLSTKPATQALAPNATATLTTTVTNGCGNPLRGVSVHYTVTSGPNQGLTGSATTNASGKATFMYSSSAQGIDYVVPSVTNPGGSVSEAAARVTWETATLSLSAANALPGSHVNFTGTGYAAGEQVTLHYNSPGGQSLVTVTATGGGAISGSFTVPVGNGANVNSIVAVGATSAKEGWAPFTTGCTDDWAAATSGNWNTPSAWTTGAVPSGSDHACIILPGTYTVTMTNSSNVGALILGTTSGKQTLDVESAGAGGVQYTSGATQIRPSGVLTLDSLNADNYSLIGGGPVTNDGTFSTIQHAGGTRFLRANITNDAGGTVSIGSADTRIDSGNVFTNNGAFTTTAGGGLSISSNGNSQFVQSGGTLTNSGSLYMNSGTWTQSGGTSSGNPVILQSSTLHDSAGPGSFLLQCGNTLNGTIAAGQSISVQANGCGSATTTLSGTVTNDGNLSLNSVSARSGTALSGGTLINDGSFSTTQGSGNVRYLRSNITNDAAGTITIGSGDTRLDSGNTLTNNGTLTTTGQGGLSISNNGNSQFIQSGGSINNNGQLYMNQGSWTQSGGTETGNPVILQASNLTDSAGGAAFLMQCSDTLLGSVPAAQTITVQANGCGTAAVYLSGTVINAGTITLDSLSADDGTYLATANGGGNLVNDGTFRTIQDAGGVRYIRSNVTNNADGTVNIATGDTRLDSGNILTNNGTFTITGQGGLSISSNGNSQFIQSGGSITNNGQLYMNQGSWTQSGGSESGNAVILQSSTLTDSAGAGSFLLQCGNTVSGTVPAGQTLTVQGNGCGGASANLSGTVTNAGTIVLDSIDADNSSGLFQANGEGASPTRAPSRSSRATAAPATSG